MGGSSKPRSPLHHTVRAERKVLRYVVEVEGKPVKLNERQRLALWLVSQEFRAERIEGYVPGSFARVMGDGNGWSAMPTIRRLKALGWLQAGTGGASWQRAERYTDAGMAALFELDAQHRIREACRTCGGESQVRKADRHFSDRHLDELCSGCLGTLLVRRAPEER